MAPRTTTPRKPIIRRLPRGARLSKLSGPVKNETALVRQLIKLRRQRGISQEQLARKMGISQPAIAKIEGLRVKNLRFRTLSRAANVLGASLQMNIVPHSPRCSRKLAPGLQRPRVPKKEGGGS
jgi:DNA-binding Xre family transcriptional regulator